MSYMYCSFTWKYKRSYTGKSRNAIHARIQHLKEVSHVDEIAVFPFVSNSDVFDLSHVSLSELRCQHPRYASDFMLKINRVGAQGATSVEN